MDNEFCQFDFFDDITINEMPVPLDEIDVIPLNKNISNLANTTTTTPELPSDFENRPSFDPQTCRSVGEPTDMPKDDIFMDFFDLCDYDREFNALFSGTRKYNQMIDPFSNLDSYSPPTERRRLLSVSSNSSIIANDLSMQLFPELVNINDHNSEQVYRYIYSESTTNSDNTDNSEFMDLEDRISNVLSTNSSATVSTRSSASPNHQSYQNNMFEDHCYFKINTKRMKANSGNSSGSSTDNTSTKHTIDFENTNICLSSVDDIRSMTKQNNLSSDISLDIFDNDSSSSLINMAAKWDDPSDLLPLYNELQELDIFNAPPPISSPPPDQVSETKPKKSPKTKKSVATSTKKTKKTKTSISKKKNSRKSSVSADNFINFGSNKKSRSSSTSLSNNMRLLGVNNVKTEIIDTSYHMLGNNQRRNNSSDSSSSSSNGNGNRIRNRSNYKKRSSTNRIRISVPSEMLENADSKRSIHNDLERQRRIDLKNLFEDLRKIVPVVSTNEKAPKKLILEKTKNYCEQLMERNDDLLNERERLQQSAKYLNDKLQMLLNLQSR